MDLFGWIGDFFQAIFSGLSHLFSGLFGWWG
jgi:hypothetical protein